MVTAAQLLELAERLLSEGGEITDRSAVSRAHYAAFWHARRLVVERIGPLESPGAEVHSEVARMVELWDVDAAGLLRDLRRTRNLADYDEDAAFDAVTARELVRAARLILTMR